MVSFVVTSLVLVAIVVVYEIRRSAKIRYIAQAELLHIRYSDLRHRLIKLGGSSLMTPEDRNAFVFLYRAITLLLRYPQFYKQMSTSACLALITPDLRRPPKISPGDFSERTRPLLIEYLSASDEL